jgi:hypothetical protein
MNPWLNLILAICRSAMGMRFRLCGAASKPGLQGNRKITESGIVIAKGKNVHGGVSRSNGRLTPVNCARQGHCDGIKTGVKQGIVRRFGDNQG